MNAGSYLTPSFLSEVNSYTFCEHISLLRYLTNHNNKNDFLFFDLTKNSTLQNKY